MVKRLAPLSINQQTRGNLMNGNQKAALSLLQDLINLQPHMFTVAAANSTSGAHLADFCASFIQKYSENLEKLENGQYSLPRP
jgi:hypothetical protein